MPKSRGKKSRGHARSEELPGQRGDFLSLGQTLSQLGRSEYRAGLLDGSCRQDGLLAGLLRTRPTLLRHFAPFVAHPFLGQPEPGSVGKDGFSVGHRGRRPHAARLREASCCPAPGGAAEHLLAPGLRCGQDPRFLMLTFSGRKQNMSKINTIGDQMAERIRKEMVCQGPGSLGHPRVM